MTRQEAEDYIYASYMRALPFLSYDMPDSMKRHPDLTKNIIEELFDGTTSVTVTGSKGKGSTAYILASILSLGGRCGLMTGPHIEKFNERFRACGEYITDDEFSDIVSRLKPLFDKIKCDPSKGEFISPIGIETAVAEAFFSSRNTDYDIYEHGKGVRYDDVRNVPSSYGIINTIFLEHTRELGSTIEAIAYDKSSVIRRGMKGVYCGWQEDRVRDIIIKKAETEGVPLKLYGRDFDVSDVRYLEDGMSCTVSTSRRTYNDIKISLMGSVQCRNLALSLAAAEDMAGEDFLNSEEDCDRLREALKSLRWFGRLSVISRDPFILIDCCINRASIAGAIEVLDELGIKKAVCCLAIPDDKDYPGVAKALSSAGYDIVLSRVDNPHYRFTDEQQQVLTEAGIPFRYEEDLIKAIKQETYPVAVFGTCAMLPVIKKQFGRS